MDPNTYPRVRHSSLSPQTVYEERKPLTDTYVWLLGFTPLIFAVLHSFFPENLIAAALITVLACLFVTLDVRAIRDATSASTKGLPLAFVIPALYLFLRSQRVQMTDTILKVYAAQLLLVSVWLLFIALG